jgi:hypothetical protein
VVGVCEHEHECDVSCSHSGKNEDVFSDVVPYTSIEINISYMLAASIIRVVTYSLPWWCRHQVPLECQSVSVRLYCATSQKTVIFLTMNIYVHLRDRECDQLCNYRLLRKDSIVIKQLPLSIWWLFSNAFLSIFHSCVTYKCVVANHITVSN